MLVELNSEKILENYSQSVNKLIDTIVVELDRIVKEDPDAERTAAHMVDRKIRGWCCI